MRGSIEPAGEYPARPTSTIVYANNNTPFLHAPLQNETLYFPQQRFSPNQSLSPLPTPESDIERKYSGTLGSTYDYRP
jgi:hypothetical protein